MATPFAWLIGLGIGFRMQRETWRPLYSSVETTGIPATPYNPSDAEPLGAQPHHIYVRDQQQAHAGQPGHPGEA